MTNFVILLMVMCMYMYIAYCSELERGDEESNTNTTVDEETSTFKKIGLDCYHCTALSGEFGCEPPHERPNVTFQKNCGQLSSVDMRQACMIKMKVSPDREITTIDRFCAERDEIRPDVEQPGCEDQDGLWECRCFTDYCNLSPLDIPGYLGFFTPTMSPGQYRTRGPRTTRSGPGRDDSGESTTPKKKPTTTNSGFKLHDLHYNLLICITIFRIIY